MIYAALTEAADKGELFLTDGGICRWHRLRDGSVTIRELIVLPKMRGRGIGKRLVQQVIEANPGAMIRAKCPLTYESNGFWGKIGFSWGMQPGDKFRTWTLCTAPMETPNSPESP